MHGVAGFKTSKGSFEQYFKSLTILSSCTTSFHVDADYQHIQYISSKLVGCRVNETIFCRVMIYRKALR